MNSSFTLRITLLFLLVVFASTASPHGPPGPIQQDNCAQKLGEHYVHFNAYQPDGDVTGHYCDMVPSTGHTIIVLDLVARSLRDKGVALNIMRKTTNAENEHVRSVPRRPYITGVVETSIEAVEGEEYVIEVIGGNDTEMQPLKFFLSVEPAGSANSGSIGVWITYIVFAALLLFLGRRFFRNRRASN